MYTRQSDLLHEDTTCLNWNTICELLKMKTVKVSLLDCPEFSCFCQKIKNNRLDERMHTLQLKSSLGSNCTYYLEDKILTIIITLPCEDRELIIQEQLLIIDQIINLGLIDKSEIFISKIKNSQLIKK